jgi:CheY-like chemotaxis protein
VDDDRDIREAMSDILADGGYDVHCYSNGREAAEALAASEIPNLILLDWMMPEMGGEAFMRHESSRILREEIPVVVVSAVADRIADLPGVQARLTKPMEVDDLLSVVEKSHT